MRRNIASKLTRRYSSSDKTFLRFRNTCPRQDRSLPRRRRMKSEPGIALSMRRQIGRLPLHRLSEDDNKANLAAVNSVTSVTLGLRITKQPDADAERLPAGHAYVVCFHRNAYRLSLYEQDSRT
eukprot:1444668-Rhodomonas_salina.2